MLDWMILPLKRYTDFSGRSRRKEYWSFFLLSVIVSVVANMMVATGVPSIDPATGQISGGGGALATIGSGISLLWFLGTIVPSIAVAIRRMHDQDKSGWFILIPIYNLILLFMEGTKGPNRFGPDPKGEGGSEVFS